MQRKFLPTHGIKLIAMGATDASHVGEPRRNLVDFAHVPVARRQTRLPMCIDPSHSVGTGLAAPDGPPDIFHATARAAAADAWAIIRRNEAADDGCALRFALPGRPQAVLPGE